MDKKTYLNIIDNIRNNPNLIFTLVDSYLEETNKKFDLRGFYNIITHNHIVDENGFPMSIDSNSILTSAYHKCKQYYDDKFLIQNYTLHFKDCFPLTYRKKLFNMYGNGFFEYRTEN